MKRKLFSLFTGIIMVLSCQAFAGDRLTVNVGEFPPYMSENLKNRGLGCQVIREVFSGMDMGVTFKFLPWKRSFILAEQGNADATGLWIRKPDREKSFFYSDVVIEEEHVFFHRKGFDFKWETVDDLKPYKIGGLIGFSYGPEIDGAVERGELEISLVTKDESNFHKLLKQRIDIYPQEINVGYFVMKEILLPGEFASIDHNTRPFMKVPSFLLFPKTLNGSEELVKRFNQGLKALRDSGRYDQIFKEFRQNM